MAARQGVDDPVPAVVAQGGDAGQTFRGVAAYWTSEEEA